MIKMQVPKKSMEQHFGTTDSEHSITVTKAISLSLVFTVQPSAEVNHEEKPDFQVYHGKYE